MSYGNPYENQGGNSGNGGNNGFQRGGNGGGYSNGGNRQGGNGFRGGRGQQQEPKTPEELARMRLPITIVVTGDDRIPDGAAMTIDQVVKAIQAKGITIRGGTNTETDQIVTKTARYVEQHAPWGSKAEDGKRYFEVRDGAKVEIRGNGSTFNTDECFEYAKRFFQGDYETANKFRRANTAKNARLLFGKNLKAPTQLVIVWSEDGADSAGSTTSRSGDIGHLVRMSCASGIPVINVQKPDAMQRLNAFLENIHVQQPPQQQPAATEASGSRPAHGPADSGFGRGNDLDDDIPY